MVEYIERDELLKFKADVYDEDGHVLYAVPTGYIVAMPPADVAPVVHGRWLYVDTDTEQFFLCNRCKKKEYWESNYCPNCGARMDLEET